MNLFLGTSALLKRYLVESGSDAVLSACANAQRVAIARLAVIEALATFEWLRRMRLLTLQVGRVRADFVADRPHFDLIEFDAATEALAANALAAAPLTGADAVQVGCAFAFRPDAFFTADRQQAAAARSLGLAVQLV
jgi:uncharacterized protein